MRRIALFLSAVSLSFAASALPIGPDDSVQGSATVTQFSPTSFPITHIEGTVKFSSADPMDAGESILLRVYNVAGVEVGTAQYTNNRPQDILSCACLSSVLTADITANPFTLVIESLAGTMEVTQLAVVAHTAPGPGRKRAAVVPTLEAVVDEQYPGIDWADNPTDIGNYSLWQGYFPNADPWLPPDHVVPDYPPKGNVPGRYPVAYEVPESVTANSMVLKAELHSDAGGTSWCESFGPSINTSEISVRGCTDEYPGRTGENSAQIHGLSWWTYWGGTASCPECAANAMGERLAQALIEVGDRHADLIDEGAGITFTGGSYGAIGSIHQSMIVPRIQDQISVVFAQRSWTLFSEVGYINDGAVRLAWGDKDPDTVNFRVQAPTGNLDHIWYRIDGSPLDTITPMQTEFFELCDQYKIACTGTWHALAGHLGSEPGISIPQGKYQDPNHKVRLDKPLIVFTQSTGNHFGLRGYYNLGLSWNTAGIVQSSTGLTVPLKYKAYKNMSTDQVEKPVPDQPDDITVMATVRRSNVFVMSPGQSIDWEFGAQSGTATADAKGEITVDLAMSTSDSTYTNLVLSRPAVDYGIVYTRAPRPTTPFTIGGTSISDGSGWQTASDVKRVNKGIPESDVVYDDGAGTVIVIGACTTISTVCVAQEPRVSPDGTKIAYSLGFGDYLNTLPGPNNFEVNQLTSAKIYVYDIVAQTNTAIPNQPAGGIARQPDWIDNDTITFTASWANTYPFKAQYDMHTGRDQFGQPRWFSAAFSVAQEYGYGDPSGKSLQLYRMDIDGTDIVNLTPHEQMALRPTVLMNGDIVYSCWQAHAQRAYDQGSSVAPGTVMNKWWLCRVNQHGGDQTSILNAHKSPTLKTTAYLPASVTGGEGRDVLKALRGVGEDADGNLYVTNYYRGNHRGLGIIYKMGERDWHVEGCSTMDCYADRESSNAMPGSGMYIPGDLVPFTPYGNSQDGPPRRYNDPATAGDDNKVVGKAGYAFALPGGEMGITHARGLCYVGSIILANQNPTFSGGEPNCDSGIYRAKVGMVTNPFDPAQLEPLIDSLDYFEWDADTVAPYMDSYGQAMPTQQTAYTPGACYLQVVDATKAELSPRLAGYDWKTKVGYLCGTQGCAVNTEDTDFHGDTIANLAVYLPEMWDITYAGGAVNQDAFGGSLNNQGHKSNTLLGLQPLLADGSVKMRVPCETPLMISGTDSDGMLIAHDEMLHSLRNGESRTCHGCHDGHSQERWAEIGATPEARFAGTLAFSTTPAMPTTNEQLTFDDIAPILESRCSSCHADMAASDPLLYSKIAWDKSQWDWPWASLIQGNRTGTAIRNVRIVAGGSGYSVGAALSFTGGTGASGYVAAVDGSGAITRIALTAPGSGYAQGASAVTAAGGSGATLEAMTENFMLHRPYTSKWVAKFARDSLLYWKCMGSRQDGRDDSDYANDIDFGAAHSGTGHTVTAAECRTIGRWIDSGIYHWQDPTP